MTALSVLDLCPIVQGSNAGRAFQCSVDLARHAERLGFKRYWLAEHHGMPGVGSAATAVLLAHVAAATTKIRVGAGGIMLPNHAPLVIAEQFGTLAALHPGRIDLGLGRAPGTDPRTSRALRRNLTVTSEEFPQSVGELLDLFSASPRQAVRAVPGTGLEVPLWILGSSLFGAEVAAAYGLPYAFASHFAPLELDRALAVYRERFKPSRWLDKPYAMAGFNVFAAETDADAELVASSMGQAFLNLLRGAPTELPPPVPGFGERLGEAEHVALDRVLSCSAIGAPPKVKEALAAFVERTRVDEVIVAAMIFDHQARLRSYEIAMETGLFQRA